MINCKTCGKELVQTEGKRAKEYCDSLCRQKAWNKKKKAPPYKEGGLYVFEKGSFLPVQLSEKIPTDWTRCFEMIEGVFTEYFSGPFISKLALPVSTSGLDEKYKVDETKGVTAGVSFEGVAPVVIIPDHAEIEAQIKAIETEKLPEHRNTLVGKKSWQLEQKKRIQSLKDQLK